MSYSCEAPDDVVSLLLIRESLGGSKVGQDWIHSGLERGAPKVWKSESNSSYKMCEDRSLSATHDCLGQDDTKAERTSIKEVHQKARVLIPKIAG